MGIKPQADGLGLARPQLNFVPRYEALRWFTGTGRQRHVDLHNLRPSALTRVCDLAAHLRFLAGCGLESSVRKCGVGKTEAEREERFLALCVEPLVADLEPFGVIDLAG